jgi:N-acetylglutamate synthase-like GNAT family acetyltransferase
MTWATGRLWDEFGQVLPVPDLDAAAASVRNFDRPGSLLCVVEHESRLIGMGALRTLEPGVVEVKRMYVQPQFQGGRRGSAILDFLLAEARETLGATVVRLDSCRFMLDAQRLYELRGFKERDPYEGTEIPTELQAYWRFYERHP